MSEGPLVGGVDGAPAGWIAVVGQISSPQSVWTVFAPTLAELIYRHPRVKRWAIDMPIGLVDSGRRACDENAREELGVKRNSVFFAPTRTVADAFPVSYARACELSAHATGKKISKQTFHLLGKIHEVRATLNETPRWKSRVFETHPELCFARLNSHVPIASKKKSARGRAERVAVLSDRLGEETVARMVEVAQETRGVGVDDMLDAAACWIAASHRLAGSDVVLPKKPKRDATGLETAIRY